jgi:hypothetical protein
MDRVGPAPLWRKRDHQGSGRGMPISLRKCCATEILHMHVTSGLGVRPVVHTSVQPKSAAQER